MNFSGRPFGAPVWGLDPASGGLRPPILPPATSTRSSVDIEAVYEEKVFLVRFLSRSAYRGFEKKLKLEVAAIFEFWAKKTVEKTKNSAQFREIS